MSASPSRRRRRQARSARALRRRPARRWLCGGATVADHRRNDFRSDHGGVFSELVTQLLARLMKHDPAFNVQLATTADAARAIVGVSGPSSATSTLAPPGASAWGAEL